MNKRVVAAAVLACALQQPVRPAQTADRWREDLAFLVKTLPEKHKNAFFRLGEKDFRTRATDLNARIAQMSDVQVKAELMKLVAAIGDGHTMVEVRPERVLPIVVHWFKDGIYIIGAPEEHRRLLGARIEQIGRMTVEDACRAMSDLVAHDNDSQLKSGLVQILMASEYLHAMGIIDSEEKATLRLRTRDGGQITVELTAIDRNAGIKGIPAFAGKPALAFARVGEPYWFALLEDGKSLYIQYNRCQSVPDNPFGAFRAEIKKLLPQESLERVIVDLRHNGGGNSTILEPLIFDLQLSRFNKEGRLFVIIGRRTFSSAVLNAVSFRNETAAKFYGEPTGGRPNHYGEVRTFELPNSKLKVHYSTKFFKTMPEDPPSLMPHVVVEHAFADYAAGRDPVLEAILH